MKFVNGLLLAVGMGFGAMAHASIAFHVEGNLEFVPSITWDEAKITTRTGQEYWLIGVDSTVQECNEGTYQIVKSSPIATDTFYTLVQVIECRGAGTGLPGIDPVNPNTARQMAASVANAA